MLVFLMSGVMCLFTNQDVHAQEPQTKRSEQDSFLKILEQRKEIMNYRKPDKEEENHMRIINQNSEYDI